MKRILAITVLCMAVALVVGTQAKDVPNDVQQTLISLDKQWGQAGVDTAKLDKIIGDNLLAISPKGEAQDKQQLIADNKATSAGAPGSLPSEDAGATTILDVSPAQLDSAGGPSRLDHSRVSVVLAPAGDASAAGTRRARVRAIRREPGAPC